MKKFTSDDIGNGDCIMIPASLVQGLETASGKKLTQDEVADYVLELVHDYLEANGYLD